MKFLLPRFMFDKIEDIPLCTMKKLGVKAAILDIDNTLVEPHTPVADKRAEGFVKKLENSGILVCIVSNNIYERAKKFADSLSVPFVCDKNKPNKKPFLMALDILKVEAKDVMVIGDQLLTDVWGANRMGMIPVLVKPVCDKEGRFVKFKRIIERRVLKGFEGEKID
ncbi:MAG: YqeG family HAD IIIA-type phosphatase [Clostridia bacterium]|nr:YqeG family HAD IIIA-type phosphatase [Clostridia bacterium]